MQKFVVEGQRSLVCNLVVAEVHIAVKCVLTHETAIQQKRKTRTLPCFKERCLLPIETLA